MKLTRFRELTSIAALTTLLFMGAYVRTTAAQEMPQVRVVNVEQRGAPPSGPFPVVIEHDQRLATHTIYRPQTLGPAKHSVLVWGEGGCAKNGLTFPEYLSEIASYGFVVVADGPPVTPAARGQADKGACCWRASARRRTRWRRTSARWRAWRRSWWRTTRAAPGGRGRAAPRPPSMPTAHL